MKNIRQVFGQNTDIIMSEQLIIVQNNKQVVGLS